MWKPDPVNLLTDEITKYCDTKGFAIQRDPAELVKTVTKSMDIQARIRHERQHIDSANFRSGEKGGYQDEVQASSKLQMSEIRPPVGFYIQAHSAYALQVGLIDERQSIGAWSEEFRATMIRRWQGYQQYAAIARTWLSASHTDDLNLFLVGPIGSSEEPEWRNFSEAVERNELVCRKLVWLPSADESQWPTEINRFLKRTFLAEPWASPQVTSGVSLDSLSEVGKDLQSWLVILDRPEFTEGELDYDALVAALLEASEG